MGKAYFTAALAAISCAVEQRFEIVAQALKSTFARRISGKAEILLSVTDGVENEEKGRGENREKRQSLRFRKEKRYVDTSVSLRYKCLVYSNEVRS